MRDRRVPPPWSKLPLTAQVAATVSVLGADLVLLVLGHSSASGATGRTPGGRAAGRAARCTLPR